MCALLGALVLAVLPLPPGGEARAAEQERASSAVTVQGGKGTLDDFSDLKVTVDQTKDLRSQGVRVSWTGGKPTTGYPSYNYLQVMQCWGDDPAGPDREQCVFGVAKKGDKGGGLVALRQLDGDPAETEYVNNGAAESFVPFRPANGEPPTTGSRDFTYFSNLDTNEELFGITRADGTGDLVFPVQTAREAPHLGCGERLGTGTAAKVRNCWLVVVPRGEHDVDGTGGNNQMLQSSPLSTSNWAQRLVFPMGFQPVGDGCALDKAERRMIGSEMATDAITSWQSRLCAGGATRFTFSQSGEDFARSQITAPTDSAPGLAFTIDPVEAPDDAPPVVHAPVALSGLTVGFFWEREGQTQVADIKLTPRLLAKILTASYVNDVRLMTGAESKVPAHLAGNAASIVVDPEFLQLNPQFQEGALNPLANAGAIMVIGDVSDVNAIVWRYVQADSEARSFLEGTADPWGTKVNPYYRELDLDSKVPVDFPKADPTETELTSDGKSITYGQLDWAPYVADMHQGALFVRRGSNGGKSRIEQDTSAPEGVKLVGVPPTHGSRRAYGLVDTASAARYQLGVAALRTSDGRFVKPTEASMLKAVAEMKDTAVPGVRSADPGKARDGAYPLTTLTYAAASTGLETSVRQDYARVLRYAAGQGQTPGYGPGELPPGYVPLPAALRRQTEAAADRLERGDPDAGASEDPAGSASSGGGGTGSGGSGSGPGPDGGAGSAGGSGGDTGGGTAGTGGGGAASEDSAPGAGPGSGAPATPPPGSANGGKNVAQSGGMTPGGVLGVVRWVLLGVLVAGGAAALAGPVLLRISVRRPT
ncbi:hypothetical protein [Streptomyces liangshanensis]|uniref:hypothetical protein n=1 Tax=Streptomyces liangshanensis TaxID=2717324 RepID=UPI0036D873E6